jgi:hypothetical protein
VFWVALGRKEAVTSGQLVEVDEPTWPDPRRPKPPGQLRRRLVAAVLVVLLLVATAAGFFFVTGYTGLPAPGVLRRYPNSELQDLADRINSLPCQSGNGPVGPFRQIPAIATVDPLQSRVHITTPVLYWLPPGDRAKVDNPVNTSTTGQLQWSLEGHEVAG